MRSPLSLPLPLAVAGALVVAAITTAIPSATAAEAPDHVTVATVSNRADLLSDGDALVEVRLPDGAAADGLEVWVAASDVTERDPSSPDLADRFVEVEPGRLLGLVDGLPLGDSVLTVRLEDGTGAWLDVTNHPNGGPVFSGPQIQPWTCQEGAVDLQCNQPADVSFVYRKADPTDQGWHPYDPDSPPNDAAEVTTENGETLPYVVRVERGYQARDQYAFATLYRPDQPWTPVAPQSHWARKVLVTHGGGCGTSYAPSGAPNVLDEVAGSDPSGRVTVESANAVTTALANGWTVMSTALNNTGHYCNIIVGAESTMMLKEHVTETLGEYRYAVGVGCSGGAVETQAVANAYPGIYDAIIVTCSYPDVPSPGTQFGDYQLMRWYFEDPAARLADGVVWSPTQWAAVEGHLSHVNAVVAVEGLFVGALNPGGTCPGVTAETAYHPQDNPTGPRCSIVELSVNQFGRRDPALWTDAEQAAGHGFVGLPFGNVGVQYGLQALLGGLIATEQFVDLNEELGGFTVDIERVDERQPADPNAIANLYRTGHFNDGTNLEHTIIVDHGGPEPGIAHDAAWAWHLRERMVKQNGHADNHLLWFGPTPVFGDVDYSRQALVLVDRWLDAVVSDDSAAPRAEKILTHRPDDARDRCVPVEMVQVTALPGGDVACDLASVPHRYGRPRTVAGGPMAADLFECQLRPLSREDDYGPVPLADDQWARLEATFPTGVCDYSKPGVGEVPAIPWQTYTNPDGTVLTGGRPMDPAPVSRPFGPAAATAATPAPATLPATGAGFGVAALAVLTVTSRRRRAS